jgi:hypothetical protein
MCDRIADAGAAVLVLVALGAIRPTVLLGARVGRSERKQSAYSGAERLQRLSTRRRSAKVSGQLVKSLVHRRLL